MKLLLQVFLAVALASVANAEVVGEITLAGQTVYVWKQGFYRFDLVLVPTKEREQILAK